MNETRRLPMVSDERPRTRAECIDGSRPCPWVSCAHHLASEFITAKQRANSDPHPFMEWVDGPLVTVDYKPGVAERVMRETVFFGSSVVEIPNDFDIRFAEPKPIPESCALDVIDAHPAGIPLEDIGALWGQTKESIRKTESKALAKVARHRKLAELDPNAA